MCMPHLIYRDPPSHHHLCCVNDCCCVYKLNFVFLMWYICFSWCIALPFAFFPFLWYLALSLFCSFLIITQCHGKEKKLIWFDLILAKCYFDLAQLVTMQFLVITSLGLLTVGTIAYVMLPSAGAFIDWLIYCCNCKWLSQYINKNNTKSHHAKRKLIVSEH